MSTIIQEELTVQLLNEDIQFIEKLNNEQTIAFNTSMNVVNHKHGAIFYDPGGITKTFIYRTIMIVLRSRCHIVLETASSGVTVKFLPDGRIAHYRFGIPVEINPHSYYAKCQSKATLQNS